MGEFHNHKTNFISEDAREEIAQVSTFSLFSVIWQKRLWALIQYCFGLNNTCDNNVNLYNIKREIN